jgi:tetratricopeptide (TPR) repeat protein
LGFSVLLSLTLGRERPSWWLPLLFFVWVQLHAMFVFGLMALAVLLAPGLIRGSAGERKHSALVGVTCVLACLINPNFITVFTRPIRYALTSSPYRSIGEWQPPFAPGGIYSPPYPYAIGVFVACCAIVLMRRAPGKKLNVALVGIALGALTLAMSLKSRRFVPLFGIAQSILLALALAPLVRAAVATLKENARRLWIQATPLLALGLGLWWLWPFPAHSYAFHYLMAEDTFPVDTLNFIEQNQISGKVFSYYNWGGYLHFRTQGAMKVYMDGRADMVFDDDTYQSYVSVLSLRPGWLQTIENSGADYALWPKNDPSGAAILQGLLATGRWRLLYEDYVSRLLVRADRPRWKGLLPTPDTAWRELALGGAARSWKHLPEAEAHFKRALDLMPYLGAACFGLARVQGEQGRLDDARQTADRCDRVYPDPASRDALTTWLDRLPTDAR